MVAVPAAAAVPGPRPMWPVGQMYAFRRDPLALLARLGREYGDVARFWGGPQPIYFLNHP